MLHTFFGECWLNFFDVLFDDKNSNEFAMGSKFERNSFKVYAFNFTFYFTTK